jgi:hypothetical protein
MFESNHKNLNKKFNWAGNIRDILCRYGFNDIWISKDVVDEDNCLCEFKQRVIDCFVSEAVAFFEDSPKVLFKKYKCTFSISSPLCEPHVSHPYARNIGIEQRH